MRRVYLRATAPPNPGTPTPVRVTVIAVVRSDATLAFAAERQVVSQTEQAEAHGTPDPGRDDRLR